MEERHPLVQFFAEYWLVFSLLTVLYFAIGGNEIAVWIGMLFVSYYAYHSYMGWNRLALGFVISHVIEPEDWSHLTVTYNMVYGTIVTMGFYHFPIWSAILVPWVFHMSFVNLISFLIVKEIIEVSDASDE